MATTISSELVRRRIVSDEPVTVIDTRSADAFDEWHIPGAINVPYAAGDDIDVEEALNGEVSPDDHIVTVCALGESSYAFADLLAAQGFDTVEVVQDGMVGWSRLYEVAAVPTTIPALEIFQIQRVAKGCLGYVVGSPDAGTAVAVDPPRHVEEVTRIAEADEMTITTVLDTHIHADHISGGRALADAVGADYYLPAAVAERGVDLAYTPLDRNAVLTIGAVELKAIHTPGHTTEQHSILVDGEALLTADAVFVDGVGRTELQFDTGSAREGAEALFTSIHRTILAMPDAVQILPGHFSPEESAAINQTGSPIRTTVKELRTELPLLQRSQLEFVDSITDSLPEKPPNFDRMIAINTGNDEPSDDEEARSLELGPNRCAAAAD